MSNDLKASGSLGFRFVKRTFDIICSVILNDSNWNCNRNFLFLY